MLITRVSKYSNKKRAMDIQVTPEQIRRWEDGELIQNVMPELTEDEREFLVSGMTLEEWDEIFDSYDPTHEEI